MKFEIQIEDWGKHVITFIAANLDQAMTMILTAAEDHPGCHVNVCVDDECVLMDMAQSPDTEANLMKIERQALKTRQQQAAKKTNATLKKNNPEHYREAGKKGLEKRWGN